MQSLLKQLPDHPFAQIHFNEFPELIRQKQDQISHPDLVEALSEREMEVLKINERRINLSRHSRASVYQREHGTLPY